jgi:hypothetical protein
MVKTDSRLPNHEKSNRKKFIRKRILALSGPGPTAPLNEILEQNNASKRQ